MERFALWFSTWMLALGLALFLMLSPRAHSAPACFPGEGTADKVFPTLVAGSSSCAAVWFCDEGTGSWVRHWISGSGAECDYGYAKAVAQLALSHQSKVDLWDATFTLPADVNSPTFKAESSLALSVPAPTAPPASGLTTKEIRVYKLTSPVNATPAFSLVGSTKLGLPCDTSIKIGSLYRIDRTLVTFPKGVLQPNAVFVRCD